MNEHNKKMSIDTNGNNEHSKISADMSTNVTLDVTDSISLLHQAITQAKQLQTTLTLYDIRDLFLTLYDMRAAGISKELHCSPNERTDWHVSH